ncbi:MAG: PQQ-dependent sugar dehydrogenase, partial [Xanthobacteraceae bacterium]
MVIGDSEPGNSVAVMRSRACEATEMRSPALASAVVLLTLACPATAQTFRASAGNLQVETVTSGLSNPWGLAFLPDGRMLVTERPGRLSLLSSNFQKTEVSGVPKVVASGQGGLLEVAPHPRFAENGFVYLSYAGGGDGGASTELARGKLVGNKLEDVQVLFRQTPKSSSRIHFGGRIVFDRAGFLYLTLGERGQQERAQVHDNHHGSVIRLND